MIWLPIPKKDPQTAKSITKYNALKKALASTDLTIWHNNFTMLQDRRKCFNRLKAAIYEENYTAFTVEDRGKFWYVVFK